MKFKEAQRLLTSAGLNLTRVNGSHYVYKSMHTTFVLPHPGSKDVAPKIAKMVLKVCGGAILVNGKVAG